MTPEQLAQATGATVPLAQQWLQPMTEVIEQWGISTPARQAAFLAQIGVECARLTQLQESFDYSAEALLRMWPARFTVDQAQQLGRTSAHPAEQQRIANIAYADRYGNRDEASGDGWAFSGKGCLQITFRRNYQACGEAVGLDLLTHPELLLTPEHAAASAAWYWQSRGCNDLADAGDFTRITLRINGGTNGLEQRLALWSRAKEALHA